MTPESEERRPGQGTASTTSNTNSIPSLPLEALDPLDALMPRAEWDTYLAGRLDGYREGESVGFARGYQAYEDELSTLQREAHRVVLAMAKLDPWEVVRRRRRERQVEAAERHASNAQPWPDEVAS